MSFRRRVGLEEVRTFLRQPARSDSGWTGRVAGLTSRTWVDAPNWYGCRRSALFRWPV